MLKLHGSAISPNYNKVKLALLEKGIEFEEIPQRPSQDESYLVNSPMGKIPCMEVDGKFFAESTAMLEYLEDAYPTAPLLPKDAFERAKCREIMQMIDLYVSGTTGTARLVGAAFFGSPISDEEKHAADAQIQLGVKAVSRLVNFAPFITGSKFTLADCVAFPKLSFVAAVTTTVLGKNMTEGIPGVTGYLQYMEGRPAVQKLVVDQQQAMAAVMANGKKH